MSRVMILAGGTGGHVMPALTVANCLRDMGRDIVWLGSRNGLENQLVSERGFVLHTLPVRALRGKGWPGRLHALYQLLVSLLISLLLMRRYKPDLVLGMGSYVSGPAGLAAWLSGRPLAIHEQNAVPGFSNRILCRFARTVFTAFPGVFSGKVVETRLGNPVRGEFGQLPAPEERLGSRAGPIRILVLGGSQGARVINELMPDVLSALPADHYQMWHQTGARHQQNVREQYRRLGLAPRIDAFIDDMAGALGWADLVVCRAGALTLSEICAVGLGSVLIPFERAADDHQGRNAVYLEEAGAALVLRETELTVQRLVGVLLRWQTARAELVGMALRAKGVLLADVDGRVAAACGALCDA